MDNFKEDHKIAFGESKEMHPHADPDNVDGWYSSKLSYRELYELASAKCAHQDHAEAMPYATVLTLLGALKFPSLAIGFSTEYLLGSLKVAREYLLHRTWQMPASPHSRMSSLYLLTSDHPYLAAL
jgi:hypothetical protein